MKGAMCKTCSQPYSPIPRHGRPSQAAHSSRGKHGDYLAAWFRHPEDRAMGKDLSIQGRHKDGDLMDVMIKLTVLETDHEILACAWVRERGSK